MKKYAIVWTTTRNYMPGTNASLNALEFYNFKNVDAYVLMDEGHRLPDEYISQFPDVNFIDLDHSFFPGKDWYWYLVFGDFNYALKNLFNKYEVVLFWSGDQVIMNNFEEYFEIAEKTGKIVIGTNEQAGGIREKLDSLPKTRPCPHTWDVPYTDIPLFIPRGKEYFLEKLFEYQRDDGNLVDRMDGLNYAIRDLNEEVIPLPGHLWVFNAPHWMPLQWNGKYLFCANFPMYAFHRKYWLKNYCKSYMPGISEVGDNNIKLFNKIYRHFNSNLRVKWTEEIEIYE